MASKGVSVKVKGRPAPPTVFEINKATGQRTQIATALLLGHLRGPIVLKAGLAIIPMAPLGKTYGGDIRRRGDLRCAGPGDLPHCPHRPSG